MERVVKHGQIDMICKHFIALVSKHSSAKQFQTLQVGKIQRHLYCTRAHIYQVLAPDPPRTKKTALDWEKLIEGNFMERPLRLALGEELSALSIFI